MLSVDRNVVGDLRQPVAGMPAKANPPLGSSQLQSAVAFDGALAALTAVPVRISVYCSAFPNSSKDISSKIGQGSARFTERGEKCRERGEASRGRALYKPGGL